MDSRRSTLDYVGICSEPVLSLKSLVETFLLLKGGGKYILEMKVGVTSVKVVIKYFGPSPFYRNMFTGEALRNFQRVGKKDSTRITIPPRLVLL